MKIIWDFYNNWKDKGKKVELLDMKVFIQL